MRAIHLPFTLSLCLLTAATAHATVIVHETLEEMTARVPLVVRGRVARVVSGWDPGHHRIWTWTELTVTETIKGEPGGVLLFKQPGGEVDGIGQAVAGVATFREGEECIVLLDRAPDEPGVWRVYGMSAGKIAVFPRGGKLVAERDTSSLSFAVPGGGAAPVGAVQVLGPVEAFVAQLRTWARGGGQ